MICPKCEKDLRGGDKFCWNCGTRIIEPGEVSNLSPVVFKLLGGIGTGLKFLGETIQDWAESAKKEGEK